MSSGSYGMSASNEYDVEAESSAGILERNDTQDHFMPPSVGFSEQGVQNRGRKAYREPPHSQRTHGHQPFYHLQHRYTKLITCPVVAILIGVILAFILFQGFPYPSTKGLADKASSSGMSASDYAESSVDDNVDGITQAQFTGLVFNNRTRKGRAGMVFRRKVLDTLQAILWVRTVHRFYLWGRA